MDGMGHDSMMINRIHREKMVEEIHRKFFHDCPFSNFAAPNVSDRKKMMETNENDSITSTDFRRLTSSLAVLEVHKFCDAKGVAKFSPSVWNISFGGGSG